MDIDKPLTERAADLLRRPDLVRLLGAATPLLGKIAVRYRPAPPPKEPKVQAPSAEAKMPPLRVDGNTTTVTFTAESLSTLKGLADKMRGQTSGEVTAPPPGPPPMPSPWLKAAVAKRAGKDVRFENGDPIAAEIVVDGACWERLDERGKTYALTLALRSIRHKERADGGDMVKIERPPIACWPDMTDEATELIAQLGPDGAEGAALTGALASSNELDNLEEAVAKFERREAAGQDLSLVAGELWALHTRLMGLAETVADQAPPCDNGPSADTEGL